MCCFSWITNNGLSIPWGMFFIMPIMFFICIMIMVWIFQSARFTPFFSWRREGDMYNHQLVDEIRQLRLEVEKLKNEKL